MDGRDQTRVTEGVDVEGAEDVLVGEAQHHNGVPKTHIRRKTRSGAALTSV